MDAGSSSAAQKHPLMTNVQFVAVVFQAVAQVDHEKCLAVAGDMAKQKIRMLRLVGVTTLVG